MDNRFSSLPVLLRRSMPGFVLATLLVGCAGTPRWGGWSTSPSQEQLADGRLQLDTYVYFARYQIYFNAARDEYTFWEERGWVTRSLPPWGTPPELLVLSPSVAMRFTDAPEQHHAAVSRLYPRDWGQARTGLTSLE